MSLLPSVNCYECAVRVTMPTETNDWYFFFRYSLVMFYRTSLCFHCMFRCSVCDLTVPDTSSCVTCSSDVKILMWLAVKDTACMSCMQLQGFPIGSHTFTWVRRTIKYFKYDDAIQIYDGLFWFTVTDSYWCSGNCQHIEGWTKGKRPLQHSVFSE